MTRIDPYVLIALQTAGFSEDEIARVFDVDIRTINDYLDCYNLGFDCALLHMSMNLCFVLSHVTFQSECFC